MELFASQLPETSFAQLLERCDFLFHREGADWFTYVHYCSFVDYLFPCLLLTHVQAYSYAELLLNSSDTFFFWASSSIFINMPFLFTDLQRHVDWMVHTSFAAMTILKYDGISS